ncbi:MAG TPA: GNAT family N-acetyltransferase [Gemmatimonadaceae bacterium]|jgi:predicted GNAT family acetyltransferase|nr:GNAT family N-acetyltransferase [Gemmatimonadaceae bacterium]
MRVEHEESRNRFFVRVGDEEAELAYTRPGRGLLDLQHTYVPESARGQGIAEALATAAFEYARQRGDQVIPTCPFVRKWLESHPEEASLVDRRFAPVQDRPRG